MPPVQKCTSPLVSPYRRHLAFFMTVQGHSVSDHSDPLISTPSGPAIVPHNPQRRMRFPIVQLAVSEKSDSCIMQDELISELPWNVKIGLWMAFTLLEAPRHSFRY